MVVSSSSSSTQVIAAPSATISSPPTKNDLAFASLPVGPLDGDGVPPKGLFPRAAELDELLGVGLVVSAGEPQADEKKSATEEGKTTEVVEEFSSQDKEEAATKAKEAEVLTSLSLSATLLALLHCAHLSSRSEYRWDAQCALDTLANGCY